MEINRYRFRRIQNRLERHRGQIYMPFGGGVNSVAMYLLVCEMGFLAQRNDFLPIYADHGGDWPETDHYLDDFMQTFFLIRQEVTVEHFNDIFDYYWHKESFPSLIWRDCTWKFKIKQNEFDLRLYLDYPNKKVLRLIGFDMDEPHRGGEEYNPAIENYYILKEMGWTRNDCKRYLASRGIRVPPKSHCWFCPFQSAERWQELKARHPGLYQKAVFLEMRCNMRRKRIGKDPLPLNGRTFIPEMVGETEPVPYIEHSYIVPYDFERVSNIVTLKCLRYYGKDVLLTHRAYFGKILDHVCAHYGIDNCLDTDHVETQTLKDLPDREIRKYVTRLLTRHPDFRFLNHRKRPWTIEIPYLEDKERIVEMGRDHLKELAVRRLPRAVAKQIRFTVSLPCRCPTPRPLPVQLELF